MKQSKNTYLPVHNSRTSRLELIAFSGLGLAGVALMATAMTNALHFAQDREAIIQALTAPGPAEVELARRSPDQTLTNLLNTHGPIVRSRRDTPPATSLSTGS